MTNFLAISIEHVLFIICSIAGIIFILKMIFRGKQVKMFTTPFLFFKVQSDISSEIMVILKEFHNSDQYLESILPKLDQIASDIYEVGMVKLKNRKIGWEYLNNMQYYNNQKLLFIEDFSKKLENKQFINSTQKEVDKYVDNYTTNIALNLKQIRSFLR